MQLTHENTQFEKRCFPITLVCDHIYFQQNLGSLFRIGEAFGIEKIIFILCTFFVLPVTKKENYGSFNNGSQYARHGSFWRL